MGMNGGRGEGTERIKLKGKGNKCAEKFNGTKREGDRRYDTEKYRIVKR